MSYIEMAAGDERDLIEAVVTCEGNLHDSDFQERFRTLVDKLKSALYISKTKDPFRVRKIEPWNSVRVTISIPKEAAQKLKLLAQQGSNVLRSMGILSVQVEGDQVISLTWAAHNNEATQVILRQTSDDSAGSSGTSGVSSSSLPASTSSISSISSSIASISSSIASISSPVPVAPRSATEAGGMAVTLDMLSSSSATAFRSPNVVAPSGEAIPVLPPKTSTTGVRPALGGPFPFVSMTHAAQAIHRSESSPMLNSNNVNSSNNTSSNAANSTNSNASSVPSLIPTTCKPVQPSQSNIPPVTAPTNPGSNVSPAIVSTSACNVVTTVNVNSESQVTRLIIENPSGLNSTTHVVGNNVASLGLSGNGNPNNNSNNNVALSQAGPSQSLQLQLVNVPPPYPGVNTISSNHTISSSSSSIVTNNVQSRNQQQSPLISNVAGVSGSGTANSSLPTVTMVSPTNSQALINRTAIGSIGEVSSVAPFANNSDSTSGGSPLAQPVCSPLLVNLLQNNDISSASSSSANIDSYNQSQQVLHKNASNSTQTNSGDSKSLQQARYVVQQQPKKTKRGLSLDGASSVPKTMGVTSGSDSSLPIVSSATHTSANEPFLFTLPLPTDAGSPVTFNRVTVPTALRNKLVSPMSSQATSDQSAAAASKTIVQGNIRVLDQGSGQIRTIPLHHQQPTIPHTSTAFSHLNTIQQKKGISGGGAVASTVSSHNQFNPGSEQVIPLANGPVTVPSLPQTSGTTLPDGNNDNKSQHTTTVTFVHPVDQQKTDVAITASASTAADQSRTLLPITTVNIVSKSSSKPSSSVTDNNTKDSDSKTFIPPSDPRQSSQVQKHINSVSAKHSTASNMVVQTAGYNSDAKSSTSQLHPVGRIATVNKRSSKDKPIPFQAKIASAGKPRQFLINPLTGHLELMPTEDSSESEGDDGEGEGKKSHSHKSSLHRNKISRGPLPPGVHHRQIITETGITVARVIKTQIDSNASVAQSYGDVEGRKSSTQFQMKGNIMSNLLDSHPTAGHSSSTIPVSKKPREDSTNAALHFSNQKDSKDNPSPATVTATSVTGEKIKLRLKLEKSEPISPAYKVDVSFVKKSEKGSVIPSGVSTSVSSSSALGPAIGGQPTTPIADQPRVPPLHISLRGKNAAVVVSPRREEKDIPSAVSGNTKDPVVSNKDISASDGLIPSLLPIKSHLTNSQDGNKSIGKPSGTPKRTKNRIKSFDGSVVFEKSSEKVKTKLSRPKLSKEVSNSTRKFTSDYEKDTKHLTMPVLQPAVALPTTTEIKRIDKLTAIPTLKECSTPDVSTSTIPTTAKNTGISLSSVSSSDLITEVDLPTLSPSASQSEKSDPFAFKETSSADTKEPLNSPSVILTPDKIRSSNPEMPVLDSSLSSLSAEVESSSQSLEMDQLPQSDKIFKGAFSPDLSSNDIKQPVTDNSEEIVPPTQVLKDESFVNPVINLPTVSCDIKSSPENQNVGGNEDMTEFESSQTSRQELPSTNSDKPDTSCPGATPMEVDQEATESVKVDNNVVNGTLMVPFTEEINNPTKNQALDDEEIFEISDKVTNMETSQQVDLVELKVDLDQNLTLNQEMSRASDESPRMGEANKMEVEQVSEISLQQIHPHDEEEQKSQTSNEQNLDQEKMPEDITPLDETSSSLDKEIHSETSTAVSKEVESVLPEIQVEEKMLEITNAKSGPVVEGNGTGTENVENQQNEHIVVSSIVENEETKPNAETITENQEIIPSEQIRQNEGEVQEVPKIIETEEQAKEILAPPVIASEKKDAALEEDCIMMTDSPIESITCNAPEASIIVEGRTAESQPEVVCNDVSESNDQIEIIDAPSSDSIERCDKVAEDAQFNIEKQEEPSTVLTSNEVESVSVDVSNVSTNPSINVPLEIKPTDEEEPAFVLENSDASNTVVPLEGEERNSNSVTADVDVACENMEVEASKSSSEMDVKEEDIKPEEVNATAIVSDVTREAEEEIKLDSPVTEQRDEFEISTTEVSLSSSLNQKDETIEEQSNVASIDEQDIQEDISVVHKPYEQPSSIKLTSSLSVEESNTTEVGQTSTSCEESDAQQKKVENEESEEESVPLIEINHVEEETALESVNQFDEKAHVINQSKVESMSEDESSLAAVTDESVDNVSNSCATSVSATDNNTKINAILTDKPTVSVTSAPQLVSVFSTGPETDDEEKVHLNDNVEISCEHVSSSEVVPPIGVRIITSKKSAVSSTTGNTPPISIVLPSESILRSSSVDGKVVTSKNSYKRRAEIKPGALQNTLKRLHDNFFTKPSDTPSVDKTSETPEEAEEPSLLQIDGETVIEQTLANVESTSTPVLENKGTSKPVGQTLVAVQPQPKPSNIAVSQVKPMANILQRPKTITHAKNLHKIATSLQSNILASVVSTAALTTVTSLSVPSSSSGGQTQTVFAIHPNVSIPATFAQLQQTPMVLSGHKMVPIKLVTLPKQSGGQLQTIPLGNNNPNRSSPNILEAVNIVANAGSRSSSPKTALIGNTVQTTPLNLSSVSLPVGSNLHFVPISVSSGTGTTGNVKVLMTQPIKMQQAGLSQSMMVKSMLMGNQPTTIRVIRPANLPEPISIQTLIKPAELIKKEIPKPKPDPPLIEPTIKKNEITIPSESLFKKLDGVEIVETGSPLNNDELSYEADIIHDEKDLADVLAAEARNELIPIENCTHLNTSVKTNETSNKSTKLEKSIPVSETNAISAPVQNHVASKTRFNREETLTPNSPTPAMRVVSPLFTYSGKAAYDRKSASRSPSPRNANVSDVHGEDEEIINTFSRSPSQPNADNKPRLYESNRKSTSVLLPDHTYGMSMGLNSTNCDVNNLDQELVIEIPSMDMEGSTLSPSQNIPEGKRCTRSTRSNTRLSPDITAFMSDTPKPTKLSVKPDPLVLKNSPKPSPTGSIKVISPTPSSLTITPSTSTRSSPVLHNQHQINASNAAATINAVALGIIDKIQGNSIAQNIKNSRISKQSGVNKRKRQESDSSSASRDENTEEKAEIDLNSRPGKRKCSENAAEMIKVCIGVEDSPKRNSSNLKKTDEAKPKDGKGKKAMAIVLEEEEDADSEVSISRGRSGRSSRESSEDRSSSRGSSAQRVVTVSADKLKSVKDEDLPKEIKSSRLNSRVGKDVITKSKSNSGRLSPHQSATPAKKAKEAGKTVTRRLNRPNSKDKSPLTPAKTRTNVRKDIIASQTASEKNSPSTASTNPESENARRKTRSSAAVDTTDSEISHVKRRRMSKDANS